MIDFEVVIIDSKGEPCMGVREIPVDEITQVVRRLCIEANTVLGYDVVAALETSLAIEESPVSRGLFRKEINVMHFTGLAIRGKFFAINLITERR